MSGMNPLATINDLPPDAIHRIINHISDHTMLGTASLISKHCSHPFQCELFRRSGVIIQLGAEESSVLLSSIVQPSHSRLLSHITSVHVKTPPLNLEVPVFDPFNEGSLYRHRAPSPVFSSELEAFLLAIPNLTRLTFHNVELNWNSLRSGERDTLLQVFTKLQEVTFYSCSAKFTVPLSLLLRARQLNVLKISDMPAVHNQEETLFPGFLRKFPKPRFQACPIRTLSLDDIGLIARFSRFAQCYGWDFFSKLQDLSICFTDYGTSPHGIPSLVVSSFLREFGTNVRILRLHVTRMQNFIGSLMDLNDLQSLVNLRHLEVVLRLDNVDRNTNIRLFPKIWMLPILKSLPSKRFVVRLDITYQIFIPTSSCSIFAPCPLSLWPLWALLQLELSDWSAVEKLTVNVDLYHCQKGTMEGTWSECHTDVPYGQLPIDTPLRGLQRGTIVTMFRFMTPGFEKEYCTEIEAGIRQ